MDLSIFDCVGITQSLILSNCMQNYYQILGVAYDATNEDIKRAYKVKAKEFHPDVSKVPNADEIFKIVNHAKDILLNPENRLQYDYHIGVKERPQAENNYYNSGQYGGYQQPEPQRENNSWWIWLIIFIVALIFGSSGRDKRY